MKTPAIYRSFLPGFLICAVLSLPPAGISADPPETPVSIGRTITIFSSVHQEERTLRVYYPGGYATSAQRYPVLYLLDGREHFHHVTGIVDFLVGVKKMPPIIVVGVDNTQRSRDFSPSAWPGHEHYTGGADLFIRFLEQDLFPEIKKRYRVNGKKILVGHSLAGTFALYAFMSRPDLFDTTISLSPCLFWHDRFMLKLTETFLQTRQKSSRCLFIAHEYTDGLPASTMKEFTDMVRSHRPESLRWRSDSMSQDDHFSLVHKSIYNGLEFIFAR